MGLDMMQLGIGTGGVVLGLYGISKGLWAFRWLRQGAGIAGLRWAFALGQCFEFVCLRGLPVGSADLGESEDFAGGCGALIAWGTMNRVPSSPKKYCRQLSQNTSLKR